MIEGPPQLSGQFHEGKRHAVALRRLGWHLEHPDQVIALILLGVVVVEPLRVEQAEVLMAPGQAADVGRLRVHAPL